MKSFWGRGGAALWLLTVQFFVAEQLARLAWRMPGYDFAHNYVSDLGALHCGGAVCSPLHAVMNASFVLQGALIAVGAVLLRKSFGLGAWYRLGLALCVVCGVGVSLVGLAPEDAMDGVHVAGATAHFVCGGMAMLVVGVGLLRDASPGRRVGSLSVAAGLAVLGATCLLGFRGSPVWGELGVGVGAVERVPAYAIPLWFAGMGAWLLLRRGR